MAKKKASAQHTANGTGLTGSDEKTDYSRWRLLNDDGRHTWHYLETDEEIEKWPQSIADKYHLGLPTVWHLLFLSIRAVRIF